MVLNNINRTAQNTTTTTTTTSNNNNNNNSKTAATITVKTDQQHSQELLHWYSPCLCGTLAKSVDVKQFRQKQNKNWVESSNNHDTCPPLCNVFLSLGYQSCVTLIKCSEQNVKASDE